MADELKTATAAIAKEVFPSATGSLAAVRVATDVAFSGATLIPAATRLGAGTARLTCRFVEGAVILVPMGVAYLDHVGRLPRETAASIDVGLGANEPKPSTQVASAILAALDALVAASVEVTAVRVTDLAKAFVDRKVIAVPVPTGPVEVAADARLA